MALFEVLQKANPQSWIPLFKPLPKKFTSTAKSFIERGMKLQVNTDKKSYPVLETFKSIQTNVIVMIFMFVSDKGKKTIKRR